MAPNGYVWWYVDALSDDGQYGITLIAFIGSVFSPYYALARRRGPADPRNFCSLNVALYGPRARWAMTERPRALLRQAPERLEIGASSLAWDGNALTIAIKERGAPVPRPIRGTVRVIPEALEDHAVKLDKAGRHRWSPIAPCARIEVELDTPGLRWSGPGYCDTNAGDAPLEDDFTIWNWSRAKLGDGTAVLYDVNTTDGGSQSVALRYHRNGGCELIEPPPLAQLPKTLWRVERETRADAGHTPSVLKTLTDAPFYSRSVLRTQVLGQSAMAVHESLSMARFRAPWVQVMLPFRMPRLPFRVASR